jgi:hypothetical protein
VRLADVVPPIHLLALDCVEAAENPEFHFGEVLRRVRQILTAHNSA